jgi:hypothetical protein
MRGERTQEKGIKRREKEGREKGGKREGQGREKGGEREGKGGNSMREGMSFTTVLQAHVVKYSSHIHIHIHRIVHVQRYRQEHLSRTMSLNTSIRCSFRGDGDDASSMSANTSIMKRLKQRKVITESNHGMGYGGVKMCINGVYMEWK